MKKVIILVLCVQSLIYANFSFSPPETIAEGGRRPHVAVDVAGNVVAVWMKKNDKRYIPQGRTKPFGEEWTPVADLSTSDDFIETTEENVWAPKVVLDRGGNATAVWYKLNEQGGILEAATKPFNGSWAPPLIISSTEPSSAKFYDVDPQLAVDPAGNVIAIWKRSDTKDTVVIQTTSKPYGKEWSSPADLSLKKTSWFGNKYEGRSAEPYLAINEQGAAIAVWKRYDGKIFMIQTTTKGNEEQWWSMPTDISISRGWWDSNIDGHEPMAALNSMGEAVVVWKGSDSSFIYGAVRDKDGKWGSAEKICDPGEHFVDFPKVVMDIWGNITVIWVEFYNDHLHVETASKSSGKEWTATDLSTNLITSGNDLMSEPSMVVDTEGNVFVLWVKQTEANSTLQMVTKSREGSWSSPEDIYSVEKFISNLSMGVDPLGHLTVLWEEGYKGSRVIRAMTGTQSLNSSPK